MTEGVKMDGKERQIIQGTNDKLHGTEAKKIKWESICVETKDYPDRPKSLITGTVQFIYPTGDISFERITKIEIWNQDTGKVVECKIPEVYKKAKKVVIRREIIAAVLYLEELPELAQEKVEKKK
jgi:hypothetical protein